MACFGQQSEKSVLEAEQVGVDANATVNHTVSDESLDTWPSLIHGSTSVLLQTEEANIRYMLWASFAEIYNEQIFDLLDYTISAARLTRPSTLQLRDGKGRPYICGLREVHVSSAEEAWQLVQIGRQNQHIASTRLNRASSRSHSIFTLRLIQVVDVDQPSVARVASLSFCDLAGSERSTASGGYNERLKEAGNINLSLMTLGRCMEALRKNQSRQDQSAVSRASIIVPFRESNLTRMFQSFLCGEGRVTMITNVSPCANVFDETLHAVNYSALASQVVVGPSAPQYTHSTSILNVPAPADKKKVSFLGKHEAAAPTSKVVLEKKRKCDAMAREAEKVEDNADQHALQEQDEDEDMCSLDEDVSDSWNDERQKLHAVIKMLNDALVEERQSKIALETQIRKEVCDEMQRQLVQIESKYQEDMRKREEILEDKYDRKMEIYKEAVQKSCKRQRRCVDEDEYVPSVDLHAAEVKHAQEVSELKNKNAEMKKELATVRENVTKLSAERDSLAEKLTKSEFSASDALHQEKTQARVECSKLRKTVEELTNKLNETEHRHEVTCRQLRRDKTQLEQKLNAAEKLSATEDHQLQNAGTVDSEFEFVSQKANITELEAALRKEQDTVKDLEQGLKNLKGELDAKDAQAEEMQQTLRDELGNKETQMTELTSVTESLKEEINRLTVESENVQKNHKSELDAKDAQAKEMQQTLKDELGSKETQMTALSSVTESLKEEINRMTVESENIQKNHKAGVDAKAEKMQQTLKDELGNKETQKMTELTSVTESLREEINRLTVESENIQKNLKAELDAKDAEAEEMLRTVRADIGNKETQVTEMTSVTESLKEEINRLTVESENIQKNLRLELDAKEGECEKLKTEIGDLKQEASAVVDSNQDKVSAIQHELDVMQAKLKETEDEAATVDLLRREIAKLTAQLLEGKDELSDKVSEIDRLEKELEVERGSRCQVEDTVADYEKKLVESKSELSQEKEKYLTCELNFQQQLTTSSQLVEKLHEKYESRKAELADKDEKLQTCHTTISDLKKKMEEERVKMETLLKDARSNEAVIEQMKLTMTEQEMTMQTQDQMLREHDEELQSVKESLDADHHQQSERLNEEIRQKNSRIRELEKEIERIRKSRECLEKDIRDITSELQTSERKLAEVKKELTNTQHKLEKSQSDETNAKCLAKEQDLDMENLRKQLKAAVSKSLKGDQDIEKLNSEFHKFKVSKEKELSAWREKRDKLVRELEKSISEKDDEIERLKANDGLKTGRGKRDRQPSSEAMDHKIETLQKQVGQLSRAASAKDQTIVDMREQNLQLQHQICQLQQHETNVSEAEDHTHQTNTSRRSKIPTSQRVPLGVTGGNVDISMGLLADSGHAVDLDETIGTKRSTRRLHSTHENSQPVPLDHEQVRRATRTRRKQTTSAVESIIAEESEGPSQARKLRSSRRF